MALKNIAFEVEDKMEHICSLCRGRMKRVKTSGNIFMCEKCGHLEYIA